MINTFNKLTEIAKGNNSSEQMNNVTFVTDPVTINIINAQKKLKKT